MTEINQMIKACYETAIEKGWHDEHRDPLEVLFLLVTEIAEAGEEWRNGHDIKEIYYNGDSPKPEGFSIEIADLAIRLFDMCGEYGINLEEAMAVKMEYNKTRQRRHGGKRA